MKRRKGGEIAPHTSKRDVNTRKPTGSKLGGLFKLFDSKLTIMVVPHSKARVITFQTNVFALFSGLLLAIGVIASLVYFGRGDIEGRVAQRQLERQNEDTQASFDELRDENNNLLETARRFRSTLSQSLSQLGIDYSDKGRGASYDGDLDAIFDTDSLEHGSTQEAADIKELTSYLDNSIQPVEQVGKMLQNQGTLFSDIPNIWPLKGGIGHISMPFGQNIHPITGQWYIHKGIDFSNWRSGDPILATANGQVVTVTYAPDFGHYVIIKHKYGIYTRYAHMRTVSVHKGDFVQQGQTIGTVGNSGITTGPHLHYEVHIGSDVVDPAKYINVKLTH